jgi:hypothetical protein
MTAATTTPRTATLTDADREWIVRQVAAAPPITAEQRAKLAELLRPVRQGTPG